MTPPAYNAEPPNTQTVSLVLSGEVVDALRVVTNRDGFADAALRRALHLSSGGPVGRPRKHSVEDLADCLGQRALTSGEFRQRAAVTLDISRASFYRLLACGRQKWLFRQRADDGKWICVSKSHNSAEVSDDLLASIVEMADRALAKAP